MLTLNINKQLHEIDVPRTCRFYGCCGITSIWSSIWDVCGDAAYYM